VQALAWGFFFVLLLLYSLQKWDRPLFSFLAATIGTSSYIASVYLHIFLLENFFKHHRTRYIFFLCLSFLSVVLLRMCVEKIILLPLHTQFYNFSLAHISFTLITIVLAFLFGGLFYIVMNYLDLSRRQQQLENQHLQTQLQVLKAQVQPHFLFNTLNNIYYLSFNSREGTSDAIFKLSTIMRYFFDAAAEERVTLQTEIEFLKNYIQLETMRIANPLHLDMQIDVDESKLVAPMLLLPFTENIFKHGVSRTNSSEPCTIKIVLKTDGNTLYFRTENPTYPDSMVSSKGTGLSNLQQRLNILYKDHFVLDICQGPVFTSTLTIPVDDAYLHYR
jgi:LytS/YehU family sensor histidine kinase